MILHVLHGWGGGAERWVRDFCASFNQAHHLVLESWRVCRAEVPRRMAGTHRRRLERASPLQRLALPEPIADTALENAGLPPPACGADRPLQHRFGDGFLADRHSLDALRTDFTTTRIVHDHYPLWFVLHRDSAIRSCALTTRNARRIWLHPTMNAFAERQSRSLAPRDGTVKISFRSQGARDCTQPLRARQRSATCAR